MRRLCKSGRRSGSARCHAAEFWGFWDDAFNPVLDLADLPLKKCFETTIHILQFSAQTLLSTRLILAERVTI